MSPTELIDEEKFLELASDAIECRIKRTRGEEEVKFKLRTKSKLYTLKTSPERADELSKQITCEKIDV